MKLRILMLLAVFTSFALRAQPTTISLEQCYDLAQKNYPLVKQHELLKKSNDYSLENASKGYLPQINVFGQATLQSDVTQLPKLPMLNVPTLSKDQYRLYVEVNQPIYEGGAIKQQKAIQQANTAIEQERIEVELFKLKERVNQLFFGILLLDEQLKQNEIVKKDIQLGLDKAKAGVENGTAIKSAVALYQAELLKVAQRSTELRFNRKAFADMLALFTNITIDEHVVLIKPKGINQTNEIKRPELTLFDYQQKALEAQNNLLKAKNLPRLNFFVQGGYGRPAFNILSNDFNPYYIGGLRLNFPLSGFYTLKNDKALIEISKQSISVQKELFLWNTNYLIKQQTAEVQKQEEILKSDEQIIILRTQIKNAAFAQLDNGTINNSDYLREANAEDTARQNKIFHEIQLLMSEYNLQTTTGN